MIFKHTEIKTPPSCPSVEACKHNNTKQSYRLCQDHFKAMERRYTKMKVSRHAWADFHTFS